MAAQKRIPQLARGLMEAASSEKEVWELRFRDLPGASDLTSHCSRTSLAAVLGNLPNTLPAPGPLHLLFFLPQMLFPGHPCGCLAHVIQTSLDVSPHPMSRLRFRLTPHLKQHPHYILSPEPVSFSFLALTSSDTCERIYHSFPSRGRELGGGRELRV